MTIIDKLDSYTCPVCGHRGFWNGAHGRKADKGTVAFRSADDNHIYHCCSRRCFDKLENAGGKP